MRDDGADEEFERVERELEDRLPNRMVPDLDRITDLVDLLGSPQKAYGAIHLTGTNGKTSTAWLADALLRAFGLRVGCYTSPHVTEVTERIMVDGAPLSHEAFVRAFDDVLPYVQVVDGRHPERVSHFEILTAMAFAAFADTPVDLAVVEVGMGGTWDATNVLHAATAVITTVGLDHRELGDTEATVAAEKAGIVHAGAHVVCGPQRPDVLDVIRARVDDVGGVLLTYGTDFGVAARRVAVGGQVVTVDGLGGRYEDLFLPVHGAHQATNAACALVAVEATLGGGAAPLDREALATGFADVRVPGRLEVVASGPTVVLDGAHNPAGARALAETLAAEFTFDRLVGVVSIFADKDVRGMLAALAPVLDVVVVTQNTAARAMPAEELGAVAADLFGPDRVVVVPGVADAVAAATGLAREAGGGVLVTGSLQTVREARAVYGTP